MKKGSATTKILGIIVIFIIAILVIAYAVSKADKAQAPTENTGSNSTGQTNNTASTDSATEWKDIKSYADADLTLYVGQGCPHCKLVEDYILQNKIDQTLKLNIKEVWYDKTNANELNAKAGVCKIASDQIGVPLLFQASTSKCYVGDQPVEDFLKTLQPPQ